MSEMQDLNAGNYSNNPNTSNQFQMAEMNQYQNYAYSQHPQISFSNPAENQQMSELHTQIPHNRVNEYEQAYYYQQNQSQLHQQPPAQPFQMYPQRQNFCIYPQPLQQGSVIQGEQNCFDTESPLLSSNMLHVPHNRETVEQPFKSQQNNMNPMFVPRSSVKNEHIEEPNSSMILPGTINSFQDADESSMQHSSHYQNLEQGRKTSIYSHPSNYASTCPSNNGGSRYSLGGIQDTSLYQIPISLTCSTTPTNIQSNQIPRFDNQQQQQQWIGPSPPYQQTCECNSPYGCQIHNGNTLQQPQHAIPIQPPQLTQFSNNGIKIEQEEIGKGIYQNQNKVTHSLGSYLVKQESATETKRISFDSGDSKGRTRVLSVPMTNSKVIEDEESENEEQSSSSEENNNNPIEINLKKEYSNLEGVASPKENKVNATKLKGTSWSSNKSIKKVYKPKKKYKQSRQKNVFKNFGNALMNSIQNNFVIRDQIEKRLANTGLIEAFHVEFLKNQLNHLKNKEDFLQGWRISDTPEDPQLSLFKSIFREVSQRFFEDYAEKYVNESDKLKNKDIHIKAIPIFIRGIQNVSELQKFKLS